MSHNLGREKVLHINSHSTGDVVSDLGEHDSSHRGEQQRIVSFLKVFINN